VKLWSGGMGWDGMGWDGMGWDGDETWRVDVRTCPYG